MKNIALHLALTTTGLLTACGSKGAAPDAHGSIDATHSIDGAPSVDAHSADARPPVAVPYGLNDVSVLLPMPASLDDPNALSLGSAGNGGALLSLDNFNAIQTFPDDGTGPGGDETSFYDQWRIVSARIDPCFPDLALLTTNPSMCQHQLRLVAQDLHQFDTGTRIKSRSGFVEQQQVRVIDQHARQARPLLHPA